MFKRHLVHMLGIFVILCVWHAAATHCAEHLMLHQRMLL